MARIKLKLGDLNNAYKIIEDVIKNLNEPNEDNARAILIKGRIMEKMKNNTEAAMNYEQAAKYGSLEVSRNALFKLAKLRIHEKDFYEAFFDIKRIKQNEVTQKIGIFQLLIDGVSFINS